MIVTRHKCSTKCQKNAFSKIQMSVSSPILIISKTVTKTIPSKYYY